LTAFSPLPSLSSAIYIDRSKDNPCTIAPREIGVTGLERAAAFLQSRQGLFFCAACLGREAELPEAARRLALWELRTRPGYEMRGSQCVRCRRGKRVIRYVVAVSVPRPTEDIVRFLLTHAATVLCDACVAFGTGHGLSDVRDVLEALTPFAEYRRWRRGCAICARSKTATTVDVDPGAPIVTETVPHRGARIEVTSYKIRSGRWRPLLVIKPPRTSSMPDMSSLVQGTFVSKLEADRHAIHTGRGWADRQSDQRGAS